MARRTAMRVNLLNATRGAILVARVSTDDQAAEDKTSLGYQLDKCAEKAKELGLPVIRQFREEGRSGAYLSLRVEMQEALAMIQRGEATHLITANLTRLARDNKVSYDIKRAVESVGGTLVFTDWDYTNNASGNLMYGVKNTVAEWERSTFRERSVTNKLERAKLGIQCSRSKDPFGYFVVRSADLIRGERTADKLGHYIINEEQAPFVQAIFERYAAAGSLRGIATWLENAGVPTPGGNIVIKGQQSSGIWNPNIVKRILDNSLYMGKPVYNKTRRMTDEERKKNGYASIYFQVERPASEWIYLEAPAIVSEELWNTCQARLHSGDARSGGHEHKQMLSGIMRCAKCGRGMRHSQSKGGNKAGAMYRYYLCPNAEIKDGDGNRLCSYTTNCSAPVLERQVIAMMEDMIAHPERLGQAIAAFRQARATAFDPAALAAAEAQLAGLVKQQAGLSKALLAATMAGDDGVYFTDGLAEVSKKKKVVQAEIETLQIAKGASNHGGEALAEVMAASLSDAMRVLHDERISTHEKNGLLSAIIETITPSDKGGYTVTFKPFPSGERVSTWTEDGNYYLSKPAELSGLPLRSRTQELRKGEQLERPLSFSLDRNGEYYLIAA